MAEAPTARRAADHPAAAPADAEQRPQDPDSGPDSDLEGENHRGDPRAGDLPGLADGRWSLTVATRTTRAHGRRTVGWLLDAAVAEFAAYGYHGASMARIARRAGTAHGTVYLHFADKDDLLQAAMTDVLADMEPVLLAVPVLRRGPEGLDELYRWLYRVCERYQRHGALLLAAGEALSAPSRVRIETDVIRSVTGIVAVLGDRIRATGTSELDPQIAALALAATVEGANRVLFRGRLLVSLEELAMSLAELIQRSIFGTEAGA
jgi:AcrR family transcriptional regulator